ncbi:hypothetical protein NliqN6_5282 [Naganishia liquefaciens]|uniref:Uncharacterized protein n=1 Tax=Naganishia liquefaciens TaxID=104408 RepID=A0A8H3TX77_9TREE|nr:hypothetical protein NliqN6_5282 [Naganishia liquefaciens]
MQGLVHYSDDSDQDTDTAQPVAGPSRPSIRQHKNEQINAHTKPPPPPPPSERKPLRGIRLRTREPSPTTVDASTDVHPGPESSTHVNGENDPWKAEYAATFGGLSDQEVFRIVSRPPGGSRGEVWEVPPASKEKPSEALQAKVANFLRLKVEQDRHINTTLLSSTAFANPHIYSKLVEFVDIDERGSAFPGGGWITRRGLEARIPVWGAKGIAAQQKAQETAMLASQATGKRKHIDFTAGGNGSNRRPEMSSRNEGERHASVEARRGHRGSRDRALHVEPRDEGSSRRRQGGGGAAGRYGRDGERDGKKTDRERRWD